MARRVRAITAGSAEISAFPLPADDQLLHLSRVIECCHDAIFSIDLDQRVVSWNPASERTYGYTASEMIGRSVTKILPSDRQSEFDHLFLKMKRGSPVESVETTRLRKDAKLIHVVVTLSPVRNKEGHLLGASIISRDITQRKKAEAELQSKQRELEDFFENAEVSLHWVGPDGKIIWANRAEMESLGYEPHEYIGRHIREFHADSETIKDILRRLSCNEKLHGYEARLKCKDGSLKHVLISSSVLWENGRFVHTRCFTIDVTERKLAEEALRRTEKMAATGRLAASIAHEINNPLAAITNLLYLARVEAEKQSVIEYLSVAEGEVRRVSEIAKRTLGFFRENKQPTIFDVAAVVDDVLSIFEPRIKALGLVVKRELQPTCVSGIQGEIRQVVANLVLNAIDASAKNNAISVRVYSAGPQAVLTVADQGCGMPPHNRSKVFEPFFTTKEETGTGLGLWVSKEIVKRHHGKITFRTSDNQSSGTIFRVVLPKDGNLGSPTRLKGPCD
jgi:PAS domain S-box-containing protein